MPTILLKHKCVSIILIWVIVSHLSSCGFKKKSKNIFFFFTFLYWEKQTWYWEKRWLFFIGNEAEIRPLEKGRKFPVYNLDIIIWLKAKKLTLVRRFPNSYGCNFWTSPSCSAADFLIKGVEPVSKSRNKRSNLEKKQEILLLPGKEKDG